MKKSGDWKSLTFREKLIISAGYLDETHAFYADKLRVKKFVEDLKITDLKVVPNVKVLTEDAELDLDTLPENCVIKSNNGCGDLIIIKNGKIDYVSIRARRIRNRKFDWNRWKTRANRPHVTKAENHYKLIKPEIFAEELLPEEPEDYKFFCFHGHTKFAHVDFDRHIEHTRNFYDRDSNLLDVALLYKKYDTEINKSNYLKMVTIADKLSSAIEPEFVRVDLYDINNKIYFGEYTFVPEGGDRHIYTPKEFNKTAGAYWK